MIRNKKGWFGALVLAAFISGSATTAGAQAKVIYACYIPFSGTVYRIKEPELKQTCFFPTHVPFSWTDGANALHASDVAGGDVSGVFSSLVVGALRGVPLLTTTPTIGQVLTYNGSAWGAASPAAFSLPTNASGAVDFGNANGFVSAGTTGVGSIPVTGPGTRMMWYPNKYAFRAGEATNAEFDDANIGQGSVAFGHNNIASGRYAFVAGHGSIASNASTTAIGALATASGLGAIAMSTSAVASGDNTLAIGQNSVASGANSVAFGVGNHANGDFAFAAGASNSANGSNSFAAGTSNTADGNFAFAMGSANGASGANSFALGTSALTLGMTGAFAYSDHSTNSSFTSAAANEFAVRAAGGFRFRTASDLSTGCDLPAGSGTFACTSSRFAKTDFHPMSGNDVLRRIERMSVESWQYRSDSSGARHVGPTAQDFRAAFGLGKDDTSISLVDIDGINLLGVKTLARRTDKLVKENEELRAKLVRRERENRQLQKRVDRIEHALERSGVRVQP